MVEISNQIKVYRAKNDLTQEKLAQKVGVTRQTIIAIEQNKYVPSLELAYKIARAFNSPLEEVFNYN